jgi:hypothetical protein
MFGFLSRAGKAKRAKRGDGRGRHGVDLTCMGGRRGGSVVFGRVRRLQNVS